MDLIGGGGQEKRLGMPNSLGPSYNNNNNNPSSSSSKIGEPAIPSKISPPTSATRRDLSSSTHNTGNGISVLDHHHHHHYQQQQIRRDSPDPPPQPPAQTQHPDGDPDPVSIAVVSAAIASISAPGSNPRTPKPTKSLSPTSVRYRECLKNHAASIGGHVVDGCGEFMPGGEEGTPEALKCAACDCHRNFHRKEVDGEPHQHGANCFYCHNPNNKIEASRTHRLPLPPQPSVVAPPLQHHHHHLHQKLSLALPTSPPSGPIPPMMMAFGGGGAATDSSSEELNVFHSNPGGATPVGPPQFSLSSSSKKRFRTKFTQEQKDKMLEFAEKIGWRIQKQDELAVQQFCAEVGVKRQVLKVWMHNNKHAMKKKEM